MAEYRLICITNVKTHFISSCPTQTISDFLVTQYCVQTGIIHLFVFKIKKKQYSFPNKNFLLNSKVETKWTKSVYIPFLFFFIGHQWHKFTIKLLLKLVRHCHYLGGESSFSILVNANNSFAPKILCFDLIAVIDVITYYDLPIYMDAFRTNIQICG